ncbi:MAG: Type 1 glutamine amidotransferase-like domain-containing protein [Minisyncoccia bacterium]
MKLLLTSAGITNKKIADALLDLVGKKADEISVAFIPTAVNVDRNDKSWYIDNLYQLKQQKYKMVDIVDISALPKEIWLPRLEAADVLFFSGGNSPHLMRWVEESGLKELLPNLLKTKVYAAISAGSVIASPTLALSNPTKVNSYKEQFRYDAGKGLDLIDFYTRPHFNSPAFPNAAEKVLAEVAEKIKKPLYALGDQTALKVIDGKVGVVGEGDYFIFNKQHAHENTKTQNSSR